MNRIPIEFRKKMNHYDIEINNDKLNVSVVDEASLVDEYLLELKKSLKNKNRVVGLDCKRKAAHSLVSLLMMCGLNCKRKAADSQVSLLIMCVSNRCLIIQGDLLIDADYSLSDFFEDESIAFVGMETSFSIKGSEFSFNNGVQLGNLASRVLKKPELLKSGLAELAGLVDLKTNTTSTFGSQSSTSTTTNECKWDAQVYSVEQMKEVVHDAYYSYLIASKLLEMS